jgi:TolB-like protein
MIPAVFTRSVALVAALTVALAPRPGEAQPSAADGRPTMAVLYFTNAAMVDREEYAPLAKGLAEMVITELAGNPGVRVVERDRIQALFDEQALAAGGRVDPETAVKAGKTLGARHLLFGTFVVDPRQNMRMDVRAINTETSALEFATSVTGKADRMLELVVALGAKVNAGLKLPALPAVPAPRGAGDAGPGPSAAAPAMRIGSNGPNQLRSMMLLSRALEAQDRRNTMAAVALMKESVAANPENARARAILASMETRPR